MPYTKVNLTQSGNMYIFKDNFDNSVRFTCIGANTTYYSCSIDVTYGLYNYKYRFE